MLYICSIKLISMKTIIYIHGFKSTGNSSKAKELSKHFNCISPTLSIEPNLAIKQLTDIIENNNVDLIVGCSLGGFYSMYLSSMFTIPCILLNPSLTPHITLSQYIGEQIRYDTNEKFNWTDEFIVQLNLISNELSKIDNYLLNFFLSLDDELLDHTIVPKLFPFANVNFYNNSTHRFKNFKDIIPDIIELSEQYKHLGLQENYLNLNV